MTPDWLCPLVVPWGAHSTEQNARVDPSEQARQRVLRARAARSVDETVAAYRDWAADYDRDVFDALGFTGSDRIADLLADHSADPRAPVLDLGCGTGAVGSRLASLGFTAVDGIDISRAMLEVAAGKRVYRALIEADLERPLPVADRFLWRRGVGRHVHRRRRRPRCAGGGAACAAPGRNGGVGDRLVGAVRASAARLGGAAPRRRADPARWPSRGDDGRRPRRRCLARLEIAVVVDLVVVFLPVVALSPSNAGAKDVQTSDVASGQWDRVVVVAIGVAVVSGAFEAPVELAGFAAGGPRHDVVDVALLGGDVAARRVLAVPVTDLDRAPQCTGEGAAMRHRQHG